MLPHLTPVAAMIAVMAVVGTNGGRDPNGVRARRQHPSSRHPDPAPVYPIPVTFNPNVSGTRRNANWPNDRDRGRRRGCANADADIHVGGECGH